MHLLEKALACGVRQASSVQTLRVPLNVSLVTTPLEAVTASSAPQDPSAHAKTGSHRSASQAITAQLVRPSVTYATQASSVQIQQVSQPSAPTAQLQRKDPLFVRAVQMVQYVTLELDR